LQKGISIEFKPSLDIRQPPQAEVKIVGFTDFLEVLITLQNAQDQIIGQMQHQRAAEAAAVEMKQLEQNAQHIRRH
jgi:hypothetical protein